MSEEVRKRKIKNVLFGKGLVEEAFPEDMTAGEVLADLKRRGLLRNEAQEMKIDGEPIDLQTRVRDLPEGAASYSYSLKQG